MASGAPFRAGISASAAVGSEGTAWTGTRTGFVFNYAPTTFNPSDAAGGGSGGGGGRGGDKDKPDQMMPDATEGDGRIAALRLFFQDADGAVFEALLPYMPYFFVAPAEGAIREVELGLQSAFGPLLRSLVRVEKEDLGMLNHFSGKRRSFLKLTFANTADLTAVRGKLDKDVASNGTRERVAFGNTACASWQTRQAALHPVVTRKLPFGKQL